VKLIDDGLLEAVAHQEEREDSASSTVVRLFKAQSRRLVGFLNKKLHNVADAQDASQEVFLKLWKQEQAGQLRDEASAYMFSTARSVAVDHERYRRSHREGAMLDLDEGELAQLPDRQIAPADELHHWREAVATLVSSLEALPEKTQRIFLLYHLENLNYIEIAQRLGVSVRSVERHMARAFSHCKHRLEDYL
jgi:RNA polymerase sigma-70 factor (ECF subfamily)